MIFRSLNPLIFDELHISLCTIILCFSFYQISAWCFFIPLINDKFDNIFSSLSQNGVASSTSNLVSEIAKARQHIKSSLERVDGASSLGGAGELLERIGTLEKDNSQLRSVVDGLQKLVISLEGRLNKLEGGSAQAAQAVAKPGEIFLLCSNEFKAHFSFILAPAADDDDVDLFGSEDEDDDEAERIKAERVKAYSDKKSKKPALIAKSSILLDCKPWDDETDMKEMERLVRTISMDGLLWVSDFNVHVFQTLQ
jgi:elongation factor 1-delta